MKSALCKMLAVVILFLSSLSPAFADRYEHDEYAEYRTECRQVWNPRYRQRETVCERVYTGRYYDVGPYGRDGYRSQYDRGHWNRDHLYYDRHRGRFDRRNRVGVQFHFRW